MSGLLERIVRRRRRASASSRLGPPSDIGTPHASGLPPAGEDPEEPTSHVNGSPSADGPDRALKASTAPPRELDSSGVGHDQEDFADLYVVDPDATLEFGALSVDPLPVEAKRPSEPEGGSEPEAVSGPEGAPEFDAQPAPEPASPQAESVADEPAPLQPAPIAPDALAAPGPMSVPVPRPVEAAAVVDAEEEAGTGQAETDQTPRGGGWRRWRSRRKRRASGSQAEPAVEPKAESAVEPKAESAVEPKAKPAVGAQAAVGPAAQPAPEPETAAATAPEPDATNRAEPGPDSTVEAEPAAGHQPEPSFRERGRIRHRARYLRALREVQLRDIGGLVLELHRFGREQPDLVQAKAAGAAQTDFELRALERALGRQHSLRELREAGVGGACGHCGAVHGSTDRYCAACGEPLLYHDDPVQPTPERDESGAL